MIRCEDCRTEHEVFETTCDDFRKHYGAATAKLCERCCEERMDEILKKDEPEFYKIMQERT